MAKVLGLEKLQSKLKLTLVEKVTKGSVLDEIGEFTKTRIYQFTKRGLTLAIGETSQKLKPLSDGYKKYRKRFQEWNKTGQFFSSSRSNLTLTGQMLEAISFKTIRSRSQSEVFVENTARFPTPRTPTASSIKQGAPKFRKQKAQESLTNREVAKRVAENGRPFLGLDVTGRNRVRLIVVRAIRKSLRTSGLNK